MLKMLNHYIHPMRPALLLLVVLLFGCISQGQPQGTPPQPSQNAAQANATPQPNATISGITVLGGPQFVCNIFDQRANALGLGGADLGVPLLDGDKMWLVFGDSFASGATSMKGPSGPAGSSSALQSGVPFDCSNFTWVGSNSSYYQPLHSSRTPGADESTVPAGGITVDGTRYIYSMRVDQWGQGSGPTHAHGALFKQDGKGPFREVISWPLDSPFVNAAPAYGKLENGTEAVFLALSGPYRDSPVYLAYVLPQEIENASAYHYLSGYAGGSPLWTASPSEAKPAVDGVSAGELSLAYDAPLGRYLLMFFDHKAGSLDLYSSGSPYGPFIGPEKSYPCGSGAAPLQYPRPAWMEKGWGGCYGGYIIPEDFGPDGHDLYYTLSVWNPYTTMVMKMRLNASG